MPPEAVTVPAPRQVRRHRAEAGQRRAGADGEAGRVGQRAAVELDLAVGDALGRGDGQAAAGADLQRLVGVVDGDRRRRRHGAVDLEVGTRRRGDHQRRAADRPGQVERAARGRDGGHRRGAIHRAAAGDAAQGQTAAALRHGAARHGDGAGRAGAGQRRAGAEGHAGRVGQRAAVELDRAVGDALGRGNGQAAAGADLQRLVGVVDGDRRPIVAVPSIVRLEASTRRSRARRR